MAEHKALPAWAVIQKAIRFRTVHALLFIMFVALIMRLMLVANGGQLHFPDEYRYLFSTTVIADSVFKGDLGSIARLFDYRDHPGAALATFAPALIHRFVYELTASNDLSWWNYWINPISDFRFSAVFFAIPSVLSIGLIFYIARRAGSDDVEALLAAFLLAASNSWLIWSRHFVTYDISMLCALAALYIALRPGAGDWRGGLLVGLLLFSAFWSYTGHVFLIATIGFLYSLFLASNPRMMIARLCYVSIGAFIPLLPILIYNYAVVNQDVLAGLLAHAGGIDQGRYEAGALLPFIYFYKTESFVSLVWMAGLFLAFKEVIVSRPDRRHRIMLWLTALVMLYGLLALISTGLQIFVLYGRTVRVLAPFVALICACVYAPYVKRAGYTLRFLLISAVALLALMNFNAVLNVQYFPGLVRHIHEEFGPVTYSSQFLPPAEHHGIPFPSQEDARYELVNVGYFYPITDMMDLPDGEVVMQVPHPYNFKPWQYTGMSPEMRDIINRDGLYIWLIDKKASLGE